MDAMLEKLILPEWWVAILAAALVAIVAKSVRALNTSGALAAFVIGFVAFGVGGGKFAIPLLTFFISSSILSRIRRLRQGGSVPDPPRGATRDYVQVLANGGAAAAIVILFRLVAYRWPIDHTRYLLMLYLAALATVNADTWATEIGAMSRSAPRLLNNWKPAPAGMSGAVTGLGLMASMAGSLLVTAAGWLVWRLSPPEFLAVWWAGFLGSFIDSLLGASLQALYRDPATGAPMERSVVGGVRAFKIRGLAWMNNDVVNFVASVGGVVCAWLLLRYGAYPFR